MAYEGGAKGTAVEHALLLAATCFLIMLSSLGESLMDSCSRWQLWTAAVRGHKTLLCVNECVRTHSGCTVYRVGLCGIDSCT